MENDYRAMVCLLSNEELLYRVYQFDEWDEEMLHAIQLELSQRGLLPNDLLAKKNALIASEDEMLLEGKEASFAQQFLGWLGVLGILGLIIGYNLGFSKTVSKYTQKEYYTYDEASRESGKYMFYISLAILIFYALYKFMRFMDAII